VMCTIDPPACPDRRPGVQGTPAPDRGGICPRHPTREMAAAETGGGETRGRHAGSKKHHERRGDPDARGTLMKRNDLSSVMASPGKGTQHDDFEREEREDLTNIHRTCPYSFGVAAKLSRSPQGRSRDGGGLRVRAPRTPLGNPRCFLEDAKPDPPRSSGGGARSQRG